MDPIQTDKVYLGNGRLWTISWSNATCKIVDETGKVRYEGDGRMATVLARLCVALAGLEPGWSNA